MFSGLLFRIGVKKRKEKKRKKKNRRLVTFRVVSQGLAFFIGQQVFISEMLFEQCEYTTFSKKVIKIKINYKRKDFK